MLELIINKEDDVENIILSDNGKVIECYTNTEEDKQKRLEGNIYSGKVIDIINGMQAAFVDFGGEKNGFIHLKDAVAQVDETKEKLDESLSISSVLKKGQKVLVQIKKDSDSTKGARVSTHISIPGQYIVLMPNANFITISQKIEDEKSKMKLLNTVKKCLPEKCGAIVRTAALNINEDELKKEIENLIKKWNDIQEKYNKCGKEPTLIMESDNIVEKIITDLGVENIQKIITNNEEEYNRLKKVINSDNKITKVSLNKEIDLIEKYDLSKQIAKMQNRKIWLNCGGFITIDRTEALTAIDVNTGKFTGNKDVEDTIFKVNKEATVEIAKQLRLRDIGGIIIIDYIDMKTEENKEKIKELLKQELKKDRAKTQVEGFTKLNLMELTRKHICSHLN